MGGPGNSDIDNEPRDVRGTQGSKNVPGSQASKDSVETGSGPRTESRASRLRVSLPISTLKEAMGTGPQTPSHL